MPATRPYSEKVAAEIDNEVKNMVESAYEAVKSLLQERRAILENLAKRLLEKEVVEADELQDILRAGGGEPGGGDGKPEGETPSAATEGKAGAENEAADRAPVEEEPQG